MATIKQEMDALKEQTKDSDEIRDLALSSGGHLTELGQDLIYVLAKHKVKQTTMAGFLKVTASAVNQQIKKLNLGEPDES